MDLARTCLPPSSPWWPRGYFVYVLEEKRLSLWGKVPHHRREFRGVEQTGCWIPISVDESPALAWNLPLQNGDNKVSPFTAPPLSPNLWGWPGHLTKPVNCSCLPWRITSDGNVEDGCSLQNWRFVFKATFPDTWNWRLRPIRAQAGVGINSMELI